MLPDTKLGVSELDLFQRKPGLMIMPVTLIQSQKSLRLGEVGLHAIIVRVVHNSLQRSIQLLRLDLKIAYIPCFVSLPVYFAF
jgi:hypothetical protein